MNDALIQLSLRLENHLESIYKDIQLAESSEQLVTSLIEIMRLSSVEQIPAPHQNHWTQKDVVMISYGDSLLQADEKPLHTLLRFLDQHTEGTINSVHILPFFPFSSDDGFAVKDFYAVRDSLGDWSDIQTIASRYRLMSDLVINHCSSESQWFLNHQQGRIPGKGFFYHCPADTDLSEVIRPRTSPLLRPTETSTGLEHLWCTFSHDQVDLDFRNPEVLKEFVRIIRFYLDHGVKIFRLDAIAFLWKMPGTSCLNLEQTHEVVRLLRTLIEHACPDAVIITETNIPNRENLSYFGNANEAHAVYNFALPPLLVYTLISGNNRYLKQWMMSMPPAQDGTCYFNFIASHDGIGLRPVEGLLQEEEINQLIETMQSFGGHISWRALTDQLKKPYEINISLADALQGTHQGADQFAQARFICAHAIMLAFEGIPGIYIHSLLATHNDHARVEWTGHFRSINRHQWDYNHLEETLQQPDSFHHQVFTELKKLLKIRTQQAAFHPNATQFTLHLGEQFIGFWRQSISRHQSIFCISNISAEPASFSLTDLSLSLTDQWSDLISGQQLNDNYSMIEVQPYQTLWISNR